MEFASILRHRRMHRAFTDEPVSSSDIIALCDAATRSPSAGFTQGTEFVIVTDVARIQKILITITTPGWLASSPTHHGLLNARALIIPVINKPAYLQRYAEPDKAGTGMHEEKAWPQPYWIVDASFATMGLLFKVVDLGLGATFMGIYHNMTELRNLLGLPGELEPLGIICIGHPLVSQPTGSPSRRARRRPETLMHFEHW